MGGRSVPTWTARGRCPRGMRRRAAGLRAHAQPDRAGRDCVRRTERCSFSFRPGCPRAARALPPSALAPRVPPGATRAAAKVGRRVRRPSTYAYSGARQSAAQHSRSQRFLAALSLFLCNGSLAVSRAQLSLPPRPSFLIPPLSLPSPCLSVFSPSLSFCLSLARIFVLFAQFQRLSVLCPLPAKRAASEQRAR